jgi:hypothetical protein
VGAGVRVREPEQALQQILTGKQSPSAEVRTLLAATRPLRELLMARGAERARATASVRMEEVLRSIWQGPGSGEKKREDTFALWDQCSEDEIGALARHHIETFVHDLTYRRGECPYTAVDLAHLNQMRRSKQPFSPCEGLDAHGVSIESTSGEGGAPNVHSMSDAGPNNL